MMQGGMVSSSLRELVRQGISFLGVGLIATAVQYLILLALVELLGWSAVVSSSIGYAISALLNYFLNYRYTFRSNSAHHRAFPKFAVVAGAGLVLNAILMELFINKMQIYYLLAQLLTTGIVLVWNFLANRLWSFRTSG